MLRIKFWRLCSHPFNFKIYGIFETFSAITEIRGSINGKFKIFFTKPFTTKSADDCMIVMYHLSYQNKTCKYYRYSLEKAKFSKSSGQGPKVKGQILKLSKASLWNEHSGILLFYMKFDLFYPTRTLMVPSKVWKCI